MGPIDLGPAIRAIVIAGVLAGVALGVGVPWLWDVAIKPLLRMLVM